VETGCSINFSVRQYKLVVEADHLSSVPGWDGYGAVEVELGKHGYR
jgi:hypothetical protein